MREEPAPSSTFPDEPDGRDRLGVESLVIELAAGFVNLDAARVDHAIGDCLRRIAIMETAPERPALTFNFVVETRGLGWVEELRLGTRVTGN